MDCRVFAHHRWVPDVFRLRIGRQHTHDRGAFCDPRDGQRFWYSHALGDSACWKPKTGLACFFIIGSVGFAGNPTIGVSPVASLGTSPRLAVDRLFGRHADVAVDLVSGLSLLAGGPGSGTTLGPVLRSSQHLEIDRVVGGADFGGTAA